MAAVLDPAIVTGHKDVRQWKRKASLLLLTGPLQGNNPSAYVPGGDRGLDLSECHFRFSTSQMDVESPNNASICVYNLSDQLVRQIRGEYTRVVLQAGYEGQFGVVFDGTIMQLKIGRESATDTYVDILAADGDIGYNFGFINKTVSAKSSSTDRIRELTKALEPKGISAGYVAPYTGGVLPRGKVLFGLPRALFRDEARNRGATWNITNGQVNVVPLSGYSPGEVVVVSALTGLVGMPESTTEGVRFRVLLNPRLQLGGLVQIDNKSINQTVATSENPASLTYNLPYTGIQRFASVTDDGIYRLFVIECQGDTRGNDWYSSCIALAVDPTTRKVKTNG